MATRNRIIYQSVALFSSPITGTAGDGSVSTGEVKSLQRVTDLNWGGEVTRQDINVMGQLANISREIIEEPVVNLDFTYFLGNAYNEKEGLGLSVHQGNGAPTSNLISGILADEGANSERNFYILVANEGTDANNSAASGAAGVIGIGNAFLTNYSVNLAVGEIPSANVSFECANLTFDKPSGTGVEQRELRNPAIDRTGSLPNIQYNANVQLPDYQTLTGASDPIDVAVLRPGDITLDFGTGSLRAGGAILDGMDAADSQQAAHIQSATIEVPLSRTPINKLGNPFAFTRPLDVPVNVSLTVNANVGDLTTGSLVDLICDSDGKRDIRITLREKCSTTPNMVYDFRGAQLDSQSMAQSIGDNQTVDLTFSAQIGGINDQVNGVFLSGAST